MSAARTELNRRESIECMDLCPKKSILTQDLVIFGAIGRHNLGQEPLRADDAPLLLHDSD
jgi:hypothetical protein